MDDFQQRLVGILDQLKAQVVTETGDWTVKGFIDIHRRIYAISLDTKVLSKVLEILMYPVIARFAEDNGYTVVLAKAQNQYPDISLISNADSAVCHALDIKTTYHTGVDQQGNRRVNGMTLGTFGGYFRTRDRPVSSTFAYNRYLKHYVLGVVYNRVGGIDERMVYDIADLAEIPSVARDFQIFVQEKYRIASDGPGSGNTKNIGSTKYLNRLVNGTGVFADLGQEVFDDYWMNYRTQGMARDDGFAAPPYSNLKAYYAYKKQGMRILDIPIERIETEVGLQPPSDENEVDEV